MKEVVRRVVSVVIDINSCTKDKIYIAINEYNNAIDLLIEININEYCWLSLDSRLTFKHTYNNIFSALNDCMERGIKLYQFENNKELFEYLRNI